VTTNTGVLVDDKAISGHQQKVPALTPASNHVVATKWRAT